MKLEKVFAIKWAGLHPMYVKRAEAKGRARDELAKGRAMENILRG